MLTPLTPSDFIQKLKSYDPNIRSSEMRFLALTFLNFSTKDIAEYTFVTVRAVQVIKIASEKCTIFHRTAISIVICEILRINKINIKNPAESGIFMSKLSY